MLFRNFPIERKLRGVILLTTGIALLLTCVSFISYEVITFRRSAAETMGTLAGIMAQNSTAALAFNNDEDAQKILESLETETEIVAAALYDSQGNLFVKYPIELADQKFPVVRKEKDRAHYYFKETDLLYFHPVREGDKHFGTLFIQSDLHSMYLRIRRYGEIALLVLAGSFVVAFVLSNAFQKSISGPILSLVGTARAVSEKGDFSVRAKKVSEDELGVLTDAFNQMLDEIHRSQAKLQHALDETKNSEEKVRELNVDLERRVEERTRELQEAVAQMEAFSYSVSHDLRSPLRSMQGYAQVVLEDYGGQLNEEAKTHLRRIAMSAVRMDTLIQDILTYSRVARGELKIESINLDRLIHDIIHQHPNFQPPNAAVTVKSPLLRVRGHEAALTQCLTNLLSNGIKFVAPNASPRVKVWTEPIDDDVHLSIEDNGIGIKPEYFERIFRMFERIHSGKSYEGTGIGLAIVKKAVDRMGGKLGVESEEGKGSRFWIILPKG